MESELRPREIQDRIRGGESAEKVAEQAGVTLDRIQAFAAPVLAERAHVATLALASSVRRRGEPLAGRTLRELVTEQVRGHGRSVDTLEWDAWRSEDRQWRLQARLPAEDDGEGERLARFRFDLKARFSAAENDDARWLLAELSTRSRDRRADGDPDTEPTEDLDDELALVRALSGDQPLTRPAPAQPQPGSEDSGPIWRPGAPRDDSGRLLRLPPAVPAPGPGPTPATPLAAGTSPDARRSEDDPYDIIPGDHSDLDVLYEMLGGLNEDSVNIYAGLTGPDPGTDAASTISATTPSERRRRRRRRSEPPAAEGPAPTVPPVVGDGPPASADGLEQPSLLEAAQDVDTAPAGLDAEAANDPGTTQRADAGATGDATELTVAESPASSNGETVHPEPGPDETAAAEPTPAAPPTRKGGAKKRASVPSWDEIMFGGPRE